MDKVTSIDIELRHVRWVDLLNSLDQVGGLPIVVIPLDADKQPLKAAGVPIEGRAATSGPKFIAAVQWASDASPTKTVRFVPVQPLQDAVDGIPTVTD